MGEVIRVNPNRKPLELVNEFTKLSKNKEQAVVGLPRGLPLELPCMFREHSQSLMG